MTETMSVAARGRRMSSTRRRVHLCGTSVLAPAGRRGTIPRADRNPQDQRRADITGCVRACPESGRRHGLARSPSPCGLISKTGFGPRKGLASGGWYFDTRSRIVPLMLTPPAPRTCLWLGVSSSEMERFVPRAPAGRGHVQGETRQERAPRVLGRLRRQYPPPLPRFRLRHH
jgi:hypothetical protein